MKRQAVHKGGKAPKRPLIDIAGVSGVRSLRELSLILGNTVQLLRSGELEPKRARAVISAAKELQRVWEKEEYEQRLHGGYFLR